MTKTQSVLGNISDQNFKEYLSLVSRFRDFDFNQMYNLGHQIVKYYRSNEKGRNLLQPGQKLEKQWYDSLDRKSPDMSVYSNDFFIPEVWACWVLYSRKYLLSLKKSENLIKLIRSNIESVVDLGCGFGYTTAALKEIFQNTEVYGTNIKESFQFSVASELGRLNKFSIVEDVKEIGEKIDFIFASEYFEHFEDPISHLNHIIRHTKPKCLVIANAFGSRSIGHFNNYWSGSSLVSNKKIGRDFNKRLRELGFRSMKTKFWNNRPSVWIRS